MGYLRRLAEYRIRSFPDGRRVIHVGVLRGKFYLVGDGLVEGRLVRRISTMQGTLFIFLIVALFALEATLGDFLLMIPGIFYGMIVGVILITWGVESLFLHNAVKDLPRIEHRITLRMSQENTARGNTILTLLAFSVASIAFAAGSMWITLTGFAHPLVGVPLALIGVFGAGWGVYLVFLKRRIRFVE